ncbi:carbohydrate ABC transporter permease [Streptomyces himalayensis]|uniref:Carbohydrate ABC transporter permease n=1 Tax=Streptomyces himalayensis subsp. himalayensis TaxID=2756131 RepID=A0A7W0DLS8_9ACTN|nr:carbohydrate ABC transporter permease [Streptomyces himalayensis]MBA2946993.1 carbohydrate ABC transporter permease [Streptomyces himalayensis subsp. himalayensis]
MTRPATRSRRNERRATALVLLIGGLLFAAPFLWSLSSSFKPRDEVLDVPPSLIPDNATWANFARLVTELEFGRYLGNTLVVVALSFAGLLFNAMAGYGFAKFRFRGRNTLFFTVLATMMIPVQVAMIPTYLLLNEAGLTNTRLGIALPTLVSAFGVFLFRQFMTTVPDSLLEAARLDGASEARIFFRIVLPLCGPILAVQGTLTFIAAWNTFLWPLIIANDQNLYTLSVGLSLLRGQNSSDYGLQMAGAVFMVAPVLVVFIAFQRYVVQGFTTSGLK